MTEIPTATTCAIVGGGPAGVMLGFLLARAGVDVVVFEKHADFFRDFRGDTIHASTIALMDELGLAEKFEKVPHQSVSHMTVTVGGEKITVVDLEALDGAYAKHRNIYLMPQWDFLDFVASEGKRYPNFRLVMGAEAVDVRREAGRVTSVVVRTAGTGPEHEVRADLVVACDGRGSTLRARAGAVPVDYGAPMDVLWFRIPRLPSDPEETGAIVLPGQFLILLQRGDYWQAALAIPKGTVDGVRAAGLDAFRARITRAAAFLDGARLSAIASWDDVKVLSVQVNRLRRWFRPGLLFLGDAAHAMSPIGGVGINLAIQDAVCAANVLAAPLRDRRVTAAHLARVEARRWLPTALTQEFQLLLQRRLVTPLLAGDVGGAPPPTWLRRVLARRRVQSVLARMIAVGVLPEHVRAAEAPPGARGGAARVESRDQRG